jgi:predicted membrane-bound mannosyltransferase/DNA-binding beta-propeller fold protein YncE
MASQSTSPAWLEKPIFQDLPKIFTIENLLVAIILVLAVVSRFAMLGERVMSHDEVNHVVPSYDLYQGRGYRHDPVTHGPFQFHVVALSYFLFGDSDFSSRIPAATFSVAAIAFVLFAYRRYLGRSGALIAGLFFLISPYILFYGRYTRNEAFIELIAVALLYGILRFIEKGDRVSMFMVTIATVLHFTVKETAFIYTAEALIFLFFMFLVEARRIEAKRPERYNRFLVLMSLAMLLVLVALGFMMWKIDGAAATATPTAAGPQVSTPANINPLDQSHLRMYGEIAGALGAAILGLLGLFTLAKDIGWDQLRKMRSFTLLLLIGSLILPMLSPVPVNMLGGNPLDYSNTDSMLRTGIFIALFFVIGAAIGLWWNTRLWLQNAFVFYAIFIVFYTTFFTNGDGFFTGIVGSLGYWLSQQGVERGNQPLYYYALIQMPIYEYLGVLGTILAVYFGIRKHRFSTLPGYSPALAPQTAQEDNSVPATPPAIPITGVADDLEGESIETSVPTEQNDEVLPDIAMDDLALPAPEKEATALLYATPRPIPVLGLLVYWGIISLIAFSFAGERMPWLTVHITMPFLLAGGWGLGYLIDTTDWKKIFRLDGFLALLLFPVFFASLFNLLGTLLGANPPFQGNTLEQLQSTNRFILAVIGTAASFAGIVYLLRNWVASQILRLATLVFFTIMAVLTARAAYMASFINYDSAKEYLVYAHAAPGPKQVLAQVEEISRRTTGGKNIQVAYSNDALYPYWWYLRDYPNKRWFQSTPTRDLRDFPIVIAGEDVFNNIGPVLGDNFYEFDYMRLWWPNQDYYNLTWDRIWNVIRNPEMRQAVFNIWLNRDYTEYGKLTNQAAQVSAENWNPASRMRLYIRKDIVAQIWNYGASPAASKPEQTDPYAQKLVQLSPDQVIGATGTQPGQFQAPRGMALAADGSIYVADSRNQRIQHIAADGSVIRSWGSFGDVSSGNAPGGTFNEPWGIAVGKDGSVYVSDTWNHRIQKFTADGQFVKMWGYFGTGDAPDALWGPRALAIDANGRLYVMDTGNKRVVIFDPDGNFITQFGSAGYDPGQFDEPVGIALDQTGNVYITDTWNQRVQVMAPDSAGMNYTPLRNWEITGWEGQSLENKPFIAVSPVNGHVFVTDPEKPRVLEFTNEGELVRGWGDYSAGTDGFGLASGVIVAPDGSVWISDGGNNVLLHFTVDR